MTVAEFAQPCLCLGKPALVAIERGNLGARTRKTDRGGTADAASSAGDDGNAARQAEPVGRMVFSHGHLLRIWFMPTSITEGVRDPGTHAGIAFAPSLAQPWC
ncbi:hypothetical protein MTX22_09825 [Bradyrhizobium sp. ISRA463]|nr:hypothetical protein MTX22_09825 [Bradyrhizobium sp. ISRA463]